ncbi:MAG: hypothetical protein FJ297_09275 [Planctomycetes bacterium]|nr:hypothetical protein [Planctomycetota bacterium]
MKEIDFLPPELVEQGEARLQRWWWLVVCLAFGSFVSSTGVLQAVRKRAVRAELAGVDAQCRAASQLNQQLAHTRTRLDRADLHAALVASLERDWPRTVVLHDVLSGFPNKTQLIAVHLRAESKPTTASAPSTGAVQVVSGDAPDPNAPKDTLREDYDRFIERAASRRIVLEMTGVTAQPASLHTYVGQLAARPLVASAVLRTLDTLASDATGAMQFVIEVEIQPAFGLPGFRASPAAADPDVSPSESVAAHRPLP